MLVMPTIENVELMTWLQRAEIVVVATAAGS